jgi:transcriptional regulator with XRE-family HTH domain
MTAPFSLRAERLNRGLTLREAADQIGVPRETLRRLEAGEGAHPANAKRVADFYGVKATDLRGDDDIGPEPRAA